MSSDFLFILKFLAFLLAKSSIIEDLSNCFKIYDSIVSSDSALSLLSVLVVRKRFFTLDLINLDCSLVSLMGDQPLMKG